MGSVGQRLLGLCLPPLVFCAADGAMTLVGQPPRYWAGDYAAVNEGAPSFNQLLQIHPAAFAAGLIIWEATLVGLILLLPDALALIVSIAATLGHTFGVSTWLLWRYHYSYQICDALFFFSAVVLGLGIRFGWQASPAQAYRLGGLHPALRWGFVVVLLCVGAYLVWPRLH